MTGIAGLKGGASNPSYDYSFPAPPSKFYANAARFLVLFYFSN